MLKVLDVDGAVRRVCGGWVATGAPWRHDTERYERIADARVAEQRAMLDYAAVCTDILHFPVRVLVRLVSEPMSRFRHTADSKAVGFKECVAIT
jgi:ATP-dependent DNA helicase RecQ